MNNNISNIQYNELLIKVDSYEEYLFSIKNFRDSKMWEKVSNQDGIYLYSQYLHHYPKGIYYNEAQLKIKEFDALEEEAWREASNGDNYLSYSKYLKEYLVGDYYKEALALKELMKDEIEPIEGLDCRLFSFEVEGGRYKEYSDGTSYYWDGFGLKNRKNEAILDAKYERLKIEKFDIVEEIKSKFNKKFFKIINGDSDFYSPKGVISSQGEILLKPLYTKIDLLRNGIGIIVTEDEKYGLINNSFEIIVEPFFSSISYGFNSGLSIVKGYSPKKLKIDGRETGCTQYGSGKYGLISDKGEIILPVEYGFMSCFQSLGNCEECQYHYKNYYTYSKNGKNGLFNHKKRKKVLSSLTFDRVTFLKKEKIFLLCNNGKFGFANSDGEITIMPELDLYEKYYEDNKHPTKGKYIDVHLGLHLFGQDYYKEEFLKVKKDDKYGLVNNKGEYILFPEYREILVAFGTYETSKIFHIYKDNYKLKGLAIYHEGSIGVAFSERVEMAHIKRVSENLVQFNDTRFGAGLVTNDGKIVLESKNPASFLMNKSKIIKEYG